MGVIFNSMHTMFFLDIVWAGKKRDLYQKYSGQNTGACSGVMNKTKECLKRLPV